MQPDDWPFVVFITCFRHKIPSQAEVSRCVIPRILTCSILEGLKTFRLCDCFKTSLKAWLSHKVQYNLMVLVLDSDFNLAAALSDLSCILVCSPEELRALHVSCGYCNGE